MNDETKKSTDETHAETPSETPSENTREATGEPPPADAESIAAAIPPPEEEKVPRPEAKAAPKGAQPAKKSGRFVGFLLVLLIALLAAAGGLAYFTYSGWQQARQSSAAQGKQLQQLAQSIEQVQGANRRLQSSLEGEQQAAEKKQSALASRLQVAEQRIIAQNKRLKSMSSTSRDDWLLAEAEYLLKLANQRVLIEREAASAEGLLDDADAILRDMVDPDLYPLRKAIAQDLAALRLSKSIDVEGIYLSLLALAQQIDSLPTRPEPSFRPASDSADTAPSGGESSASPWWSVPLASIKRFAKMFSDQIKVTPHGEAGRPVVLMQPETHLYLMQNLRMQIERAQLALLREQQKIYSESLSQAAQWVSDYFPVSEQAQTFTRELDKLSVENVVKQLPDISGSWELLNTYIQDLHDLKGQNFANKPQAEAAAASETAEQQTGESGSEQ